MFKSFSLWLESNLEMKQAVNASLAAHLNAARIGLHNLKGTGVRFIKPGSRMGHKLASDHIVVGQKGAYAAWDRDDNQWVPLPVNLHPAKEVLFGKMDRAIQPDQSMSDYDLWNPTSPSDVSPRHDKRDNFYYDRPTGKFGS